MRDDYPPGTIIKGMNPAAKRGVILGVDQWSQGPLRYRILFDGVTEERFRRYDEVAPEDHPWHDQMRKWVDEGRNLGHSSIYIAIDEQNRKYRAFFGDSLKGYQSLIKKYPELRFRYFWTLYPQV